MAARKGVGKTGAGKNEAALAHKSRIDWKKIESDYMRNGLSLRLIALKYGISQSAVFKKSAEENWPEKRQHLSSKSLARARARMRAGKEARIAAQLDRIGELADRLTAEIERALGDEDQLYRYLVGLGNGRQGERVLKKLDARTARELAETLRVLGEMGKDMEAEAAQEDAGGVIVVPGLDESPVPEVEVGETPE